MLRWYLNEKEQLSVKSDPGWCGAVGAVDTVVAAVDAVTIRATARAATTTFGSAAVEPSSHAAALALTLPASQW